MPTNCVMRVRLCMDELNNATSCTRFWETPFREKCKTYHTRRRYRPCDVCQGSLQIPQTEQLKEFALGRRDDSCKPYLNSGNKNNQSISCIDKYKQAYLKETLNPVSLARLKVNHMDNL